jgi:hypothetical protein
MRLDPTDADWGVDPSEYDEEPPQFRRAEALVTRPVEVTILEDVDIDF